MQTLIARSMIAPSERQKKYGWAVAGFVLVGGFGTIMGILQSRSSDERYTPSDQSLDSLDALPLADRAGSIDVPGGPFGKDSRRKNASWTSPESMLYQAPGGEQPAVSGAESADAAGDKLMQDMAKASGIGKKPGDPAGWGGEAARTGLTTAPAAARPNITPMASSFGGGGTSGAGASSGAAPFGVGQSHPGEGHASGLTAGSVGGKEPLGRGNQSIAALRRVAGASGNARSASDAERMWGHTSGAFDGSSAGTSMGGGGGSDSGVGAGSGIPGNLKDFAANSGDISKKDIQPPAPPPPKPVDNATMQKQQMMMMAAMVGVGLLGVVMQSMNSGSSTSQVPPGAQFTCPTCPNFYQRVVPPSGGVGTQH